MIDFFTNPGEPRNLHIVLMSMEVNEGRSGQVDIELLQVRYIKGRPAKMVFSAHFELECLDIIPYNNLCLPFVSSVSLWLDVGFTDL